MKKLIFVLFFIFSGYKLLANEPAASRPTATSKPSTEFKSDVNQVISNSRQLTFTGPRAGEGYFSADGQKMIFQSEREEGNPFYQMYVMDLKTGKTQRVSPGQGKTTCGWIHPNGQRLMWSSTHLDPHLKKLAAEEYENRKKPIKSRYAWSYDDTYDIFESDLKGQKIKRLTREKGYDAEGSYSPNGQWIAFASNRAGFTEKLTDEERKFFEKDPSYMMDIYIMKADGTQVKRLTDHRGYDGGPFFSADGKKITWRRFTPDGYRAEIYTMNVDGSEQKAVTRLNAMSWAPYYHPTGDYIIFTSSVLGHANFELFIVDAAGLKQPVRVTFADGFDGLPTFSPDGEKISWTRRNEKGESQIYLADWDDAQARELLGLRQIPLTLSQRNQNVNEADLKRLVYQISSAENEGRRAGSAEEKALAMQYAQLFKSYGLVGGAPNGSFIQRFEFTSQVSLGEGNKLEFSGVYKNSPELKKFAEPFSLSASGQTKATGLVFAGYGIKAPATEKFAAYNSYKDIDVAGKWVVLLKDIPDELPADHQFHLNSYSRLQHKVTVAREAGAVGLVVIDGLTELKKTNPKALRFEGSLSSSSLPVWKISGPWVKDLFKSVSQNFDDLAVKLRRGEVLSFDFKNLQLASQTSLIEEKIESYNVIARKPGKSSQRAVLLGAHGDHLGRGEAGSSLAKANEQGQIHYGADDNASGVASVLELAQKFSRAKTPARDIYFSIWSAEEIGLLGSKAFVTEWEKTKGEFHKSFAYSINIDMVGRLKDRLQIQGVGSGDAWTQVAEEIGIKTALPLSLTEDPYLPTDAMTFYLAKVPSISFFTGAHSEYHSPRDTAQTINFAGLYRITVYVESLTEVLSGSALSVVKYRSVQQPAGSKMEGRSFKIYLGTIPDYSQEGVKGVRISGVSKNSPADQSGLKEKDIIIEFAGTKIENIYDYVYTLQTVKPDQETMIKVMRNGVATSLKIVPKIKE